MSSVEESLENNRSTNALTLDLTEIQATVLRPRPAPYFGTHVLLRVNDAQGGRAFLRRLTPHVDSAASWWSAVTPWLAVGISYAGLEALGVPQGSLQSFPVGFREGMAARARHLGDEGVNDPKNWDQPYGKRDVHIGVSAFSDSEEDRRRILAIAREQVEGFSGVSVLAMQDFGAKPGEFILGYPSESGVPLPMPQPDVLGRNGTYVGFRKYQSLVGAFNRFLQA